MVRSKSKQPRVVLVTRPTWYESLLATHGTHQQAEFFLRTREESMEPVLEQHRQFVEAQDLILKSIPVEWRRARVSRDDLDRFLFEPEDLVVALGQDGLVANTAKYLSGQVVLGVNPSPAHFPGVLVRLDPATAVAMLEPVAAGRAELQDRTMVRAELDDGQQLLALNEIFVGHSSHQSARYELHCGGEQELQSSSGVIIATGTGATGWAASIRRERKRGPQLPGITERRLVYFTREAWPSATTGTRLTAGELLPDQTLQLTSRMNLGGVVFGDGIESDRLTFDWGRRLNIGLAAPTLRLAVA